MKKYILGMAKGFLDLNGAKAPKLELDFLRLLYVVKEIRKNGGVAQGYLLVMDQGGIYQRVNKWRGRYQSNDEVEVIPASLTANERQLLETEKNQNRKGILAEALGEEVNGRSDAIVGKGIGETKLKEYITNKEKGVGQIEDKSEYPFGIQWDFYGIKE